MVDLGAHIRQPVALVVAVTVIVMRAQQVHQDRDFQAAKAEAIALTVIQQVVAVELAGLAGRGVFRVLVKLLQELGDQTEKVETAAQD